MKTRALSLGWALLFAGCVRSPGPPSIPLEDDTSIVFPQFFEHAATEVGSDGGTFEFDGEMLRALTLVARDFAPSAGQEGPCSGRPEAHRYRAVRQGDVIFVYVYEDHRFCGRAVPSLDSGAKYAVSADGRILRRVLDGQPSGIFDPVSLDGGPLGELAEPGTLPGFDAPASDAGSPPEQPDSPPPTADGGLPGSH